MLRVLVADDSPTVRELLVAILESDPQITVVGKASNGLEAVELAARLRPDLITMDIHMPELDGFEATKEIMIQSPTPILIVSSRVSQREIDLSLNATRAGALMVLPTPDNPQSEQFAADAERLIRMAKAMAQVKVVRRWPASAGRPHPRRREQPDRAPPAARAIAIAASTGGPGALQRILLDLPRDHPVPILVVQHIAPGFSEGLCSWLGQSCNLRVKLARQGEPLSARTVYLAPDDRHLGVHADGTVQLASAPPVGGFRPSATFLFQSAARAFGASVVAVVLSGMGRDGVDGLRAVHEAGGWVIAQDEATSVVYGMPQEALRSGAVDLVLPLHEIAACLVQLTQGDRDDVQDPGR